MPKKKSNEEFINEVKELVGIEYEFLETYVNTKTKLKVRHNICNNIYLIKPNDFQQGHRCPYCSKRSYKKSNEEFINEVKKLVDDEYEFLEEYINNKTKLKVRHNICNKEYFVSPIRFLSGDRCPYCFGNIKKSNEEFINKVKELVGNEYEFLEPYVNSNTRILVRHNKCNNIYKILPKNFLYGSRCLLCSGYNKKSNEEFINEVRELVGNEYEFLEVYINTNTKLKVRHNICNKEYFVTPNNFLQGYRCPYCSNKTSKGEERISKYLDKLNIKYKREVSFSDCKNKLPLKFDFQIFINDNFFLLEYDGEQHFSPVYYLEDFENIKKRDNIKNIYCKNKNIPLYRISYKFFNDIELILQNILNIYIF